MTEFARELEELGILLSHGVADALTTAVAATTVGPSAEGNPLIRALLADGIGFAVGAMLLGGGAVAVAYPRLAAAADFPRWFAPLFIAVGLLVSLGNIAVVLLA